MSEERRPNRPELARAPGDDEAALPDSRSEPKLATGIDAPARPLAPGMDAPTPEEGTPSFDEMDALLKKESLPPVGETPDYASAYEPPRTLPKAVDHRTIENLLVHISPEVDPRRARTQKLQRVIDRERAEQLFGPGKAVKGLTQRIGTPGEYEKQLAAASAPFGPASGPVSGPSSVQRAPLTSQTVALLVVVLGVLALATAIIFAVVTLSRDKEPVIEAVPSPPPPVIETVAPPPAVTPVAPPATVQAPAPAETETPSAAPSKKTTRGKKPSETGPRPIIE